MSNLMRFCEFTGDGEHDFDEVGFKKKCPHIGFTPRTGESLCLRHNKPIQESAGGWLLCCDECESPIHDIENRKESE